MDAAELKTDRFTLQSAKHAENSDNHTTESPQWGNLSDPSFWSKQSQDSLTTSPDTTSQQSGLVPDLEITPSVGSGDSSTSRAAAEAIRNATYKDYLIDIGTDESKIFSVLGGLSEAQRTELRTVYEKKYGIKLENELKSEMSGSYLEKGLNLLARKDGTTDNAGFVKELVTELNHTVQGRNRSAIAQTLRQKVATMSSSDIAAMNNDYQRRYGTTAEEAILNQGRIDTNSKDALKIYFKGANRTTDSDMIAVAEIGLKAQDLEMFTEAMSKTSPEARKEYGQRKDLDHKLFEAFQMTPPAIAQVIAEPLIGGFHTAVNQSSGTQAIRHAEDYIRFGKLSAMTQIRESSGWIDDNEQSIETALKTMSKEERALYKEGSVLTEKVDLTQRETYALAYHWNLQKALARVGNQEEIAGWDKLARGEGEGNEKKTAKPGDEIIAKLEEFGSQWDADDGEVVMTVEKAFRENTALYLKIADPRTEDDKSYSKKFHHALRDALGSIDYETYGKKLVSDGSLSVNDRTDLSRGYVYNETGSMAKSVLQADEDEKELLLCEDKNNKKAMDLQSKIFGKFNQDQVDCIKTVLKQGAAKPEDQVRSLVVGAGATTSEVMQLLARSSAEEQTNLNQAYSSKYGSNLVSDLMDTLEKDEQGALPAVLKTEGVPVENVYNEYLNRYTTSKDGIGEWFVNDHWDCSGYQAEEAVNLYAKELQGSVREQVEIPEHRQREMAQQVAETLATFAESKRAAADATANAIIIGAAIAAAPFTGGTSLTFLAKVALYGTAGAAIKVATAATMNGADYGWTFEEVGVDAGTGFVSGAIAAIGPGEMAKLFQIGNTVGTAAAGTAADSLALLAEKTGENMLKEGSKEVIEQTFGQLVRQALLTGSNDVPVEALKNLAGQVAVSGKEDLVLMAFELSLSEATKEATASLLAVKSVQYGLPTLAGGTAGATSGAIKGAAEWDTREPIGKNAEKILTSATTNGAAGALTSLGVTVAVDALSFTMASRLADDLQYENSKDAILKRHLGSSTILSDMEALTTKFDQEALKQSIKINQDRFRDAVSNHSIMVAQKQSYQVQFNKAVEDTTITTLENPTAPVKANQWIATRLNPDGTPNIENGFKNQWVVDDKVISKSYALTNVDDLKSPELTLWTKTDTPPVRAIEMTTSGQIRTPWGPMQYQPGDKLVNYDFDALANQPGTNYARVTAGSWKQTYEIVPGTGRPELQVGDGLDYGLRYIPPKIRPIPVVPDIKSIEPAPTQTLKPFQKPIKTGMVSFLRRSISMSTDDAKSMRSNEQSK